MARYRISLVVELEGPTRGRSVPTKHRGIALTARRGVSEGFTQLYPTYRTPPRFRGHPRDGHVR
jgi:hypothetical protein